jgi:hypothetical protein
LSKDVLTKTSQNILNNQTVVAAKKEEEKEIYPKEDFHKKGYYNTYPNKEKTTYKTTTPRNNKTFQEYNNNNITNSFNKYHQPITSGHNLINYRKKHYSDHLYRSTPSIKLSAAVSTENIASAASRSFGTKAAFFRKVNSSILF